MGGDVEGVSLAFIRRRERSVWRLAMRKYTVRDSAFFPIYEVYAAKANFPLPRRRRPCGSVGGGEVGADLIEGGHFGVHLILEKQKLMT